MKIPLPILWQSPMYLLNMLKTYLIFGLILLNAFTQSLEAIYIQRYTTTNNGAIVFTGNSLGLSKTVNVNQPGVSDGEGAFITTDLTQQVGTYPPGTTLTWQNNSSSAVLDLPSGSTVLYAELFWAGSFGLH